MKLDGSRLLLSLSALALVLFNLAALPASSAHCTNTSPRASLLSHWRRLFPSTPEIPDFLVSKSSHLTATQINTFLSYIDANTLDLSGFCSAANILCPDDSRLGDLDTILPNDMVRYKYPYEVHGKSFHYNSARLESGFFFREANITSGEKLDVPDIRDKLPRTSFLPKCLSDKLRLSSKSLQGLVELLGVSKMQHAMNRTVSVCELPPDYGEKKSCVQSIEDMADFVAATVGSKAEVITAQSADGWGQVATVGNVIGRNGRQVTPTVVCHRTVLPYLAYYCHSPSGVKVYEVELLIGNGTVEKKNRVTAICHMDTSKWSAGHPSFAALGSEPGKIEVCHLNYEGELVWVARESPLKQAAGLPDRDVRA